MPVLFTNNASTTLASGITAVATSITVATGQGSLFPNPSAPDFFYATLANASNVLEIVKCTARSGDTLTVTRAQEGTTATAYSTGDKIELRPTAAGLSWKVDQDYAGTLSGNLTFSGTHTVSGTTALNGTLSGTGLTNYLASPAAIGGTTAAAGTFTTLTATTSVTAPNVVVNNTTVPANGIYRSAANTLAFATNTTARGTVDANGAWVINAPSAGSVSLTVNGVSGTHSFKIEDSTGANSYNGGYLEVPSNGQTGAYSTVLSDSGKQIYYTGATGVTITIPANASVAYPVGTVLTIINDASAAVSLTISVTTDTLQWANGGTTGNRTLARYGIATCVKVTATKWIINGTGLT